MNISQKQFDAVWQGRYEAAKPESSCEVCGKVGKAADKCSFERACSCWYGVACVNGEGIRKHDIRPVRA